MSNLLQHRLYFVYMNLVGKMVEVQVKSGEYYEGILHTVSSGTHIVLKMARKKSNNNNNNNNNDNNNNNNNNINGNINLTKPFETMVIYSADFVQIFASNVNIESLKATGEFSTDTDISGVGALRERKLEKWLPDSTSELNEITKWDPINRKETWDQFATNKKKFGVKSTYQEELYTTALDKSSDFYKEKEQEATKIAFEIENSKANNPHLMEERGYELEDSGIDEEDRYSSVIRENQNLPPRKPKLFVPENANISDESLKVRAELSRITNSSPVTSPGKLGKKSPLHSFLVGDPRFIGSFLIPGKPPQVSKQVVSDFYDFQLEKKKKEQEEQNQHDPKQNTNEKKKSWFQKIWRFKF